MHRFILFFFFIVIFSVNAFSQEYLEKGNFMIGGGASFSYSSDEKGNLRSNDLLLENIKRQIIVSPYFGFLAKDNLLIGVGFNYVNTFKNDYLKLVHKPNEILAQVNEHSITLGINLFVRQIWPITEKFGAYIQPSIAFSNTKVEDVSFISFDIIHSGRDYDFYTTGLETSLGLYYFISNRFSFESTLANLAFLYSFKNGQETTYGGLSEEVKIRSYNFKLNLIQSMSFDKILTINYYF